MRWISIDPGKTNGWSYWEGTERLDAGEDQQMELYERIERYVEDGLEFILYENYVLRQSSAKAMIGNKFPAAQVIGVLKWLAHKHKLKIDTQMPAQKEFFDNDKLKRLGLYDKGMQHCRDSVRHALYYQFFTAKIRDLKELTKDE